MILSIDIVGGSIFTIRKPDIGSFRVRYIVRYSLFDIEAFHLIGARCSMFRILDHSHEVPCCCFWVFSLFILKCASLVSVHNLLFFFLKYSPLVRAHTSPFFHLLSFSCSSLSFPYAIAFLHWWKTLFFFFNNLLYTWCFPSNHGNMLFEPIDPSLDNPMHPLHFTSL